MDELVLDKLSKLRGQVVRIAAAKSFDIVPLTICEWTVGDIFTDGHIYICMTGRDEYLIKEFVPAIKLDTIQAFEIVDSDEDLEALLVFYKLNFDISGEFVNWKARTVFINRDDIGSRWKKV